MDSDNAFISALSGHPIFDRPEIELDLTKSASLELSTSNLSNFTNVDPTEETIAPSGRWQIMVYKDADLILASGKELRIATMSDPVLNRSTKKSYKVLHTPNIQYEIHQLCLNPNGKLLAVAGAYQLSVVVLPRAGYSRLVTQKLDCKSIQIGQYHHATKSAAPIVKVAWHPWGEAGTTLLVMTADGKMREYDISADTEEPQQVLSFVPERHINSRSSFIAEDPADREVASFALGNGAADWGPLTMYAVMKSGDVYAICPYMPKNSSVPSAYVHSLECFISAKQEFLSQGTSAEAKKLNALYDYQRKYVTALIKQLPSGTSFPTASRPVSMHPPDIIRAKPALQGPFLLQPAPRTLDGSPGANATDICYLPFSTDEADGDGEMERLGVVVIAFQDGKVDLCLDVEKAEARWEQKHGVPPELPMLAVYEAIDLGLVDTLREISVPPGQPPLLELLEGNHPVLLTDPINDDTVYVYHAFGVHALQLRSLLQSISAALHVDEDDQFKSLANTLEKSVGTTVQAILTTFSVERRCSNPVVAVAITNDIYLAYSITVLTSVMRVTCFPLHLTSASPLSHSASLPQIEASKTNTPNSQTSKSPFVSLLEAAPFSPPTALARPLGLPTNPTLSLGSGKKAEFMLTPETLRYLAKTVEKFTSQIHEVQLAFRDTNARVSLHTVEARRQQENLADLKNRIRNLGEGKRLQVEDKIKKVQEDQQALLARTDHILQVLLEKASPGLSEYEKKWFEELKSIKSDIVGESKYDEGSMVSRVAALENEYARLLPNLEALTAKEAEHRNRFNESIQSIGVSQAFEIGERSSAERVKIAKLEKSVLKLMADLDISIEDPPSKS